MQGVFGRLGDLGAVDKKYDAAVSNSAGGLDNIVVDTVTTAQKCIAFLRQHNLGRCSFINLEMQARHSALRPCGSISGPSGWFYTAR